MTKNQIIVNDTKVTYKSINGDDYISLTDIAKQANSQDPSGVIRNWMSNKDSFHFYSLWEEINNPNFNSVEMRRIEVEEVGYNRFTMTPKRWKQDFNAIGIVPSAGKYSQGTFAHKDIAFEFASWLSPIFKLYLITEFQRLKAEEQKQVQWNAKRELARVNYKIHTDAIKQNIIPNLKNSQISFAYASEADLLNVALFGQTAGEWRVANPNKDGNIRDYATLEQLLILTNMESYNAILIEEKMSASDRLIKLNQMAKQQMQSLLNISNSHLLDSNKQE